MGQSGNPAKRDYKQHQKELEATVRKAVAEGKGSFMVKPFKDTEVVVQTNNPDHAWTVCEAIQPLNDDNTHPETQLAGILMAFQWYCMVAEENPRWFKELKKALANMNEEFARMEERMPTTRAAMKAAGIKPTPL